LTDITNMENYLQIFFS